MKLLQGHVIIWTFIPGCQTTIKTLFHGLRRSLYKTTVPISEGGKNAIIVTDFDIYSINKPNHLALRVINDYEFEHLMIDDEKYMRVSESILVGVDKAMAGLDSIRNACR